MYALLEHLPVSHFNGQEYHHQRREPDATSTKPKNTRASICKQLCSGIGGDDTSNSTQTRQHATDAAAILSVEKLGSRGVEDSIEVLIYLLVNETRALSDVTYGLHDVLERIQSNVTSSIFDLRIHGHRKTLADCRKDQRPLSTKQRHLHGE